MTTKHPSQRKLRTDGFFSPTRTLVTSFLITSMIAFGAAMLTPGSLFAVTMAGGAPIAAAILIASALVALIFLGVITWLDKKDEKRLSGGVTYLPIENETSTDTVRQVSNNPHAQVTQQASPDLLEKYRLSNDVTGWIQHLQVPTVT